MKRLVVPGALLAALVGPGALAAGPSPTPEPEDPIRVVISKILPRAPKPGGVVEIAGVLRNTGSEPVTDLRVRLQIGDRIKYRGELEDADQDRPPTFRRVSADPGVRTLAPGQTTAFSISTTATDLGLTGLGVYPLDVVARGNAGDGVDNLGLAPTWLPFFGAFTPRPTRVAVVWPLVDVPHLDADGSLLDTPFAPLLARSGRLGRLLDTARVAQLPACEPAAVGPGGTPATPRPDRCDPVQVTYAVDPDLLDAAQTLADSKQDGAATAAGWLDTLRATGLANRVLALPYADPDVSALSRDTRTNDDVANATALGREVVSQVLRVSPETVAAWPPAGPVTPAAADALSLSGARAFVLDPSVYDDKPDSTPDTHALFATSATGAELTGLVVEPDLSDLVLQGSPYGSRVAEQRFLAETAIISAQSPSTTRTLVIALPRRADVPPVAAEELRDLGRVPWLCSVSLVAVATSTESCDRESGPPAEPADRGDVVSDDSDELSPSYLRSVAADRDQATQLTDAIVSPALSLRNEVAALKGRFRRAVARAESSIGRDDPDADRRAAASLHALVQELSSRVIVRGGRSLLTSSKGTLSVSLENTLDLPVQVRVRFTSKTATLTNAETGLVTVQPGHAVQASVRAKAQRSGQFVVFAQLVDRDGKVFGPETEIVVRSTRFGRVAIVVTLVAFGVLLAAAGYRITRRIRAARA